MHLLCEFKTYTLLAKSISRGNREALEIAFFAVSIFAALLTYNWLKDKNSVQNDNSTLWKYWFIGIAIYTVLMATIANQPKESLIGAIALIMAVGMIWIGSLKYLQKLVETDDDFCRQEAFNTYKLNYYIRMLLDYRLYAKKTLSEKYLVRENIKKEDEEESLYWAQKAYESSDAYVDGYTIVKLKK